jgi:PAS domain S-box-containing protein
MPNTRRNTRAAGLVIGVTIMVLAATAGFLAVERSNSAAKQQRLVVSNYRTISLMREALIAVQDTEIGERTYLLTGNASDLRPYEDARLRVSAALQQIEAAASADANARAQVVQFQIVARERLRQLNAGVSAFQAYGRDSTQLPGAIEDQRETTERLREIADTFVANEASMLTNRLATLRAEQEQADLAGLLVLSGAFVCLIVGMVIIMRGSGKLEAARSQLTARSRLLQTTLETLHDPIFVLDPQGTVVAWNQTFTALAGWDPTRQPPPARKLLTSDRSPVTKAILEALDAGESAADGPRMARVSHDGREYEVSYGEMFDGGMAVRCVDITDKLRDETALRQGQKMEAIGQLTGGMAHDFNNILQVIQANLDLIRGDAAVGASAMRRLRSASAATDRGARLTQQLLAFARRQPLAPQPTSVARLVKDLSGLLVHALGERVAVELAVADDAWNAKIDPGQLENAILNLAINARDAMPHGGSVRIEVSNATLDRRYAALYPEVAPGAYLLVDVSDTGTGMSPDVVARAFDPFFTTKNDGKGTGLGLSMVYGFVQQSSGHIRIDSAIGQGTSVKLFLPRTTEPVLESPSVPTAEALVGHERILVVEDNGEVRQAVIDMLSEAGYRTTAAANPDEAAALLARDAGFDLLLTDVVMPGSMSATELAGLARRLRTDIVVLMTSGYARDRIPEFNRLNYPILTKPYRQEELLGRIRHLLTRRAPASQPSSGEASAEAPRRSVRPRRVLVVEDEVVLRMSIVEMLERMDCVVTAVGDGEQALELLERDGRFDLLLTDLGLPGMNGEDLASRARAAWPDIPVIIASGYSPTAQPPSGVQFVSKPYSSIDLQQALERARQEIVAG